MRNVRRFDPEGRPVFITQACKGRERALLGLERLVLAVMQELRCEGGWRLHAHVILPDHMHLILGGRPGFSQFMQSMKLRVVRRAGIGLFWQNRFHDHVIRNDRDLRTHLDYLHYNPVRHGHASTPEEYAHSSFRQYQARGLYVSGWGHSKPDNIDDVDVE
jgi:putative transposase